MPYRSVAIASGASYGCWIGSPLVSRCLKGCKAFELNPIWPITIGGDRQLAIRSLHFWRSVRIPWQKFQTHKIHKLHTPFPSGPGRALGLGLLEAFSEVPNVPNAGPTWSNDSLSARHWCSPCLSVADLLPALQLDYGSWNHLSVEILQLIMQHVA